MAGSTFSALLLMTPVIGDSQAGKYCGNIVEGGKAAGKTRDEASIAAKKWWSSRAGALGRGYEDWDNASDQELSCSEERGQFQCQATARPCLPVGTLPEHLPKLDI